MSPPKEKPQSVAPRSGARWFDAAAEAERLSAEACRLGPARPGGLPPVRVDANQIELAILRAASGQVAHDQEAHRKIDFLKLPFDLGLVGECDP